MELLLEHGAATDYDEPVEGAVYVRATSPESSIYQSNSWPMAPLCLLLLHRPFSEFYECTMFGQGRDIALLGSTAAKYCTSDNVAAPRSARKRSW